MRRKIFQNTTTSLLLQVVTVVSGFILPRLILEYYGSAVNGLIQSITQFLGIITFLELGVGQVIQSSLYEPLSQGNIDHISRILKSGTNYFRKIAYAFLGYIAVLILVYPYIINRQFSWHYTAVLIIAISAGSFAQYYFGIIDKILLSADQRGYVQYSLQIVCTVINTVAVVVLIRVGCSLQTVKLATAAIFLVNPFAVRWYVRKKYQINRKITYQDEPIKQKWNGITQHISAVVLEGTDNVVLTLLATLSDVSIYSVYFMVISGMTQLYRSATAGIQSAIGTLWARKETQLLEQKFQCVEMALHFIVVFLFSCIGTLVVPFVKVYTNNLTDAQYVQPAFALLLTVAYAVRCLCTPYNIMILAAGHYKQTQRCHIVTTLLNVVISVFAVVRWGLAGVAVGTLAAFAYQTVWMAIYNSKNFIKRHIGRTVKQFAVDAVAMCIIMLATAKFELQTVSYWGWICMAIPVALIAFTVVIGCAFLFYRRQLFSLFHSLKKGD